MNFRRDTLKCMIASPRSKIEDIFRLSKTQQGALKKLKIATLRDLLYHFPIRLEKARTVKRIADIDQGDEVIIYGTIEKIEKTKAFRKKISLTRATIRDGTGTIRAVWFHQPYIAELLKGKSLVELAGKVSKDAKGLYLANPESRNVNSVGLPVNALLNDGKPQAILQPVYPESRGITSRWFFYSIKKLFGTHLHEKIEDPLPSEILKKYRLPSLSTAFVWVHQPRKRSDYDAARKRFAFEEIFFIQLARQKARQEYKSNPALAVKVNRKDHERFLSRFSFSLTGAQKNAIESIFVDFKKDSPMMRLLEGDVGSGKTAVAAATAHAVAAARPLSADKKTRQNFGNLQVAFMAPTEILARQHFESLIEHFSPRHNKNERPDISPFSIALITSSGCQKFPSKVNPDQATPISRSQLLKWVANGEIPLVVGTHSLIQKTLRFKHLAYVVIDEQHRFGTMQRAMLARKIKCPPHLLSMTATPIPRTLALTLYGDLDLTLLDEMPPGRKRIITEIVSPEERNKAYEKTRAELKSGRQAYVICPRIDEPDPQKALAIQAKSVKTEAKHLRQEIFPEYEVEILHSKMRPKEREEIMQRFLESKIQILVATSVIEVGVNVPNATTIIIEGAERFGLAQLYQFRGRVLRSTHQSYCFVFADTKSRDSVERLKALKKARNGFELAELDLKLRGAGDLAGRQQWGVSDIGMEAIKNIKMVEAAREEAKTMLETDKTLKKYPLLAKRVELLENALHLE